MYCLWFLITPQAYLFQYVMSFGFKFAYHGGIGVASSWSSMGNFIEGQEHPGRRIIEIYVILYIVCAFCLATPFDNNSMPAPGVGSLPGLHSDQL